MLQVNESKGNKDENRQVDNAGDMEDDNSLPRRKVYCVSDTYIHIHIYIITIII